ncbi:MAG TPA: hypothetical protein VGR37_15855 [Longimicrobiaceae bacterium]|nr:hypothetical protein [Longimicrobiaceae bacterium]
MIEIKDAVAAATEFARRVYDEHELRGLRLEELEADLDGRTWKVTLGWIEPDYHPLSIMEGLLSQHTAPRVYKTFLVDAHSGQVRSMRIRETA